jgi:hypothetical protein
MKNYDLNVWDKRGYETEYREEGWHIDVYEIPSVGASYGSGEYKPELGFPLTPSEVQELTLGVAESDGGDYTSDSDFWLDVEGFLATYKSVPARVASLLKALPVE